MTTNLAERLMIDKLKWNKSTAETRWHARWWICLIHWNYRVDFIKRIFGSLVHVFRFWWSSSLIWAKSKFTFARFNWLFSKQFPIHSGTMCSDSSVKMIRKHRNIGKMHFDEFKQKWGVVRWKVPNRSITAEFRRTAFEVCCLFYQKRWGGESE